MEVQFLASSYLPYVMTRTMYIFPSVHHIMVCSFEVDGATDEEGHSRSGSSSFRMRSDMLSCLCGVPDFTRKSWVDFNPRFFFFFLLLQADNKHGHFTPKCLTRIIIPLSFIRAERPVPGMPSEYRKPHVWQGSHPAGASVAFHARKWPRV